MRWRLKSPVSRLFTQPFIEAQIKEKSKLRVTDLCEGNSPVTSEFPTQRASNAENVSIWWRHHARSPNRLYGHAYMAGYQNSSLNNGYQKTCPFVYSLFTHKQCRSLHDMSYFIHNCDNQWKHGKYTAQIAIRDRCQCFDSCRAHLYFLGFNVRSVYISRAIDRIIPRYTQTCKTQNEKRKKIQFKKLNTACMQLLNLSPVPGASGLIYNERVIIRQRSGLDSQ